MICGPNLAPEVARRKPAGTVVASHFDNAKALLGTRGLAEYTRPNLTHTR